MGFFSNFTKNWTIRTVSERVLKELSISLESYQKLSPGKTIKVILKDRQFHKTLNIRNLHGNVVGNAENVITPLPDVLENRENDVIYLVANIVNCIVMHELSYDKSIGERVDIETVFDVVNKNIDKYIKYVSI